MELIFLDASYLTVPIKGSDTEFEIVFINCNEYHNIMWGIEFTSAAVIVDLPLLTTESMITLAVGLLGLRMFIQIVLERAFGVQGIRKEHNPNSL